MGANRENPGDQEPPALPLGLQPDDAAFLRALVEGSPAGICILEDERFVFVNQRLAEIFGGEPRDLLGRPLGDFIHPEDRDMVLRRHRLRHQAEEQTRHYELRARNADGSYAWLEVRPTLVELNGRQAVMSIVLNIDWRKSAERARRHFTRELEERVRTATERQRGANQQLRLEIRERELAQRQLKLERDRAQLYLDVAQVALVALDHQGRVNLINRRGCRLLGRTEEEILGAEWFERFAPPRQEARQRRYFLERLVSGRHSTGYAAGRVSTARGEEILVAWHYVVLRDREGRPSGVLGSGEDITQARRYRAELEQGRRDLKALVTERTAELKRLNLDLKESEAKFRAVFEQAPTGICHATLDGRFLLVNPRLCQLWGYSPAELLRLNIADIMHPEDLKITLRMGRALLTGQKGSYTLRKRYRRKDGAWQWGRATVSLVRNARGEPGYFIAVIEELDHRPSEGHPAAGGERLARLMDQVPFSLAVYDRSGTMISCNSAFVAMWQVETESAVVGHFNILKDIQAIKCGLAEAVSRALAGETVDLPELVFDPVRSREPGRKRIARSRAFPLHDSRGRVMGAVLTHEDITETISLRQQQQMVAAVYEHSREGIIIADSAGVVQMVNPAFSAITGYQPVEVVGRRMSLLRERNHSPQFLEKLWQALSTRGQWRGRYWNRRKNGEAYLEGITLSVPRDPDGIIAHFLAIFHEASETRTDRAEAPSRVHHDALTGLPGHSMLEDRLTQALRQAQRKGCQVGVVLVALDGFSRVNRNLGYGVGDGLLRKVAQALTRCVRQVDTVARLGGDQFMVVITEVDAPAMVTRVARRILEHLKVPFRVSGHQVPARASLGIAMYPMDGQDPATLINNAGLARNRARPLGGDKYQLHTEVMQQQASRDWDLEKELRAGLNQGALGLCYQPRVSLGDGRVIGAQASLAWNSPEGRRLAPGEFLPMAEESGLIISMGNLALSLACQDCLSWQTDGHPDLRVALGLALPQLERGSLAGRVRRVLAKTGLPAGALELEIDNAALIRNPGKAQEVLSSLAALGVCMVVGGFGAGLSPLDQLTSLPIQGLKVDRSLVSGMADDPGQAALVRAVVSLGHCLDLAVTAEGVAHPRQEDMLRQAGCDQAQGPLFGASCPLGEFLAGLAPGSGTAGPRQ